ncbi:MAG: hypothetical protein ACP5KN_19510, partial [Armatimonadota bacterium]
MASRSLGMVLVSALIAASGSVIGAQEILIEAEDFDCAQQSIVPAHVSARENASGGMLAVVRDRATGAPTWLDYMIAVEGGLYELLVRAGGNNSRQAAMVSVDGGPPVTVLDDPPDSLPLGRAMPEDYEERSRLLERSFREHLLGRLQLPAGTHRIRVQHAGMADRSNSFGFDWLKLTAVEDSEAEVIEVGDRPEPQWGARSPQRPDLELAVLTGYRFWGPDETPRCTVMLFNRELETPVSGTLAVHLVG